MTNPFLKSCTVGEWLRSSLCWTGACLGSMLLGWLVLPHVLPTALASSLVSGMPTGTVVAHVLIWRYAVRGGRAIIRQDEEQHEFTPTRLAANLWLVALTLFQLSCLLVPVVLLGLLVFAMWT